MVHQEKAKKEWVIQGYFFAEHGWEDVDCCDNKASARENLAWYRANGQGACFRLVCRKPKRRQYE